MKKSIAATLYGSLTLALIGFSTMAAATSAPAGFNGAYAAGNWTTNLDGGNGSVITSGAPHSTTINGSDGIFDSNGDPLQVTALTSYTITAVGAGKVIFDWGYQTNDGDGPLFDPAGYLLNGIVYQLSNDSGANSQNGSASFDVVAGNIFGFYVDSDSLGGRASLTISSFSAPVPEPGQAAMLAMGLLVLGYFGSRNRQQT